MPRIVSLDGDQSVEIDSKIVVGREESESVDLVIALPSISRRHAEISISEEGAKLFDRSTYGTKVNDVLVMGDSVDLTHGDVLDFEGVRFSYEDKIEVPAMPSRNPGAERAARAVESAKTHGTANDSADNHKDNLNVGQNSARSVSQNVPGDRDSNESIRKQIPQPQQGTVFEPVSAVESVDDLRPLNPSTFEHISLVVRNGALKDRCFTLDSEQRRWIIGSNRDCDIRLIDPGVSDKHAVLESKSGRWQIDDCLATNVLRINGQKQSRGTLSSGDIISLGGVHCEFIIPRGIGKRRSTGNSNSSRAAWIIGSILVCAAIIGVAIWYMSSR